MPPERHDILDPAIDPYLAQQRVVEMLSPSAQAARAQDVRRLAPDAVAAITTPPLEQRAAIVLQVSRRATAAAEAAASVNPEARRKSLHALHLFLSN